MIEKKVIVKNKAGIHCRPSSAILSAVEEFPDVTFAVITLKGEADLTSILGLLTLGIASNEEVIVRADGDKEEDACNEIATLFGYEFDFPQN